MSGESSLSRRDFVRTGAAAGAGLVIGFHLPGRSSVAAPAPTAAVDLQPNAWIRISTDGLVTIVVDEAEMGQGPQTAVPQMIADELEADWSMIRIAPPPLDPSTWVRSISTGGSTTVRLGWEPLRKAGATARELLRNAAAQTWGIPVERCRADSGFIVDSGSGNRIGYGDLVETAATLPVPEDAPLKDPADFKFMGHSVPRTDIPDKVTGKAVFGLDVKVPDMAVATVAKPHTFGARARSFDASGAMAVAGVRKVVEISSGVAVVADNTWAALKGRDALTIEWDQGPNAGLTSAVLFERWRGLAERRGEVEREEGDIEGAMEAAAQRVDATFELPFLDHATMEPMNCTAVVRDGTVEVWAPTQVSTRAQQAAARVAEVPPESVVFHTTLMGGGFGRRLQTDYVQDAVEIAMQVDHPVKVVWTREDTTRHGFYRPANHHHLWAGLDEEGWPVAWAHRIVGPAPRGSLTGGAANPPYRIPNFRLDYHLDEAGIPVGAWRSVANTQNGFVVESFIDELAAAAGKDPYEYRRHLMADAPRLRGALELVAEKAGWGTPLPDGVSRGIAAWSCFGSYVAEVAEVEVAEDQSVRVRRIVCGVDCGHALNPRNLAAQVEGGVTLALTYTLKGAITIEDGGSKEGNFHDYPLLQLREMPSVEVHIVPSTEPPGGIGEPGVPPVAPAVTNAIFAATGKRIRRLPIITEGFRIG